MLQSFSYHIMSIKIAYKNPWSFHEVYITQFCGIFRRKLWFVWNFQG